MLPLAVKPVVPILAMGDGYALLSIIGTTLAVVICAAIPLTVGASRGHVAMGIIGALFTVPVATMFCFIGGIPVAVFFSILIKLLPRPNRPLLNQAEIEQEVRRIRGY
jgi:hypothetical protein